MLSPRPSPPLCVHIPLLRPEDLMRLPRGMMLCMVEPEPFPFFTYAPAYPNTPYGGPGLDENPYFRKRRA